jgi:hypothetical protein
MANLLHSSGKEIDYNSDDQIYKTIRKEFPDNAEGYKQFSFSSARKRMCTRVSLSMLLGLFCIYTRSLLTLADTSGEAREWQVPRVLQGRSRDGACHLHGTAQ